MRTFGLVFCAIFFVVFIAVLASMIVTVFWYCCDDYLANLVGWPELGQLPFTFVWPFCLFIMTLFKSVTYTQK